MLNEDSKTKYKLSSYRWPPTDDDSIHAAVNSVLQRGILVDGPEQDLLESEFADVLGFNHAVAVSSGTAAITAALLAAGVGFGDLVIVPALTFSGSVLPVLHIGAKPVFIDVDPKTFCVDPWKLLEVACHVNAKAIVLVHLHGYPVELPHNVVSELSKYNIKIIEDACQAPFCTSSQQKKVVGLQGVATAYSFNEKKQIFAGEGGMLATNSEEIACFVKKIRRYGEPINQPKAEFRSYISWHIGYNWKLSEIHASIARVILERLDKILKLGKVNAKILSNFLDKLKLKAPITNNGLHAWHKYRVLCPPQMRDIYVSSLRDRGIPVSFWQTEILPRMPAFRSWHSAFDQIDYPNARQIIANSFIIGDERYPLYGVQTSVLNNWIQSLEEICS